MTKAFKWKVALVTGVGDGIGLATAEAFVKAGVILADRDEETIGRGDRFVLNDFSQVKSNVRSV